MRLPVGLTLTAVSIFLSGSLAYDDSNLPTWAAEGNFVTIWYGFSDPADWHPFNHYPYLTDGAHCNEVPDKQRTKDPDPTKFWLVGYFYNTTGSIECKFFEDKACNTAKGHSKTWVKQGVKDSTRAFKIAAYACRLPFAGEEIKPAPSDYEKDQ